MMPDTTSDYLLALHLLAALLLVLAILRLRRWPWLYAIAIWPGTAAHELLHAVAGLLMGAKPVSMTLIPQRKPEGGWVLGSVMFARLRWWNSVPVGLAPLALVPAGGWVFWQCVALPLVSMASAGLKLLTVQCLLACWPSPRDWSHATLGLLMLTVLGVLVYLVLMHTGSLPLLQLILEKLRLGPWLPATRR
jgi:hypothetical protein